jgi:hypothetical protein
MAQINKPDEYFNTKLYTGNATARSITGVGFQPDWVWIKGRTTAYNNTLFDSVRGATKRIYSNGTDAESTQTATLTSFDSDGFSLGNNASVNSATSTFVTWNWLASNTTASNTDGSITSTVSANTTSGFSIVSYTGTGSNATVGHGLGAVPKMIIVKNRDSAQQWQVYHIATGNTKSSQLSGSGVPDTASTYWNDTSPTSTVFSIGTGTPTNGSTNNIIAYCFAEVKGFSKFGSYVGNGNADGSFIYTGFKPAFVIFKNTTNTNNWSIRDNKRDSFNAGDSNLFANLSDAESSSNDIDFLSNGFKLRNAGGNWNTSGNTYIYHAFAEEPLVGDNPATAR